MDTTARSADTDGYDTPSIRDGASAVDDRDEELLDRVWAALDAAAATADAGRRTALLTRAEALEHRFFRSLEARGMHLLANLTRLMIGDYRRVHLADVQVGSGLRFGTEAGDGA